MSDSEKKHHNRVISLYAWRYKERSRTFFYRWLRQSNWQIVTSARGGLQRIVRFVKWIIGIVGDPLLIAPVIGGNWAFFPIASRLAIRAIKPNFQIRSIVESEQWDLVVIPTSGADPASFDFIAVCQEMGIRTLALVDNWDNLVSKTVFWRKPTFLGVWGPQAKEQAVQIHGFVEDKVLEIGNPRFEPYFQTRTPADPKKQKNILFVGSAMPFDELGALHLLETCLEALEFSGLKVIYRPHPWQQKRLTPSLFRAQEFRFSVLDEQMRTYGLFDDQYRRTDASFQPDLDYYPRLFGEALIVIGPLTTMLLEASICLRQVIGLTYKDGAHFNTNLAYFSHFSGMDRFPGFQFCKDAEDLLGQLETALNNPQISTEVADLRVAQYLRFGPSTYAERLNETIAQIVD